MAPGRQGQVDVAQHGPVGARVGEGRRPPGRCRAAAGRRGGGPGRAGRRPGTGAFGVTAAASEAVTTASTSASRRNVLAIRWSCCNSATAPATCWLTWAASAITSTTSPTVRRPGDRLPHDQQHARRRSRPRTPTCPPRAARRGAQVRPPQPAGGRRPRRPVPAAHLSGQPEDPQLLAGGAVVASRKRFSASRLCSAVRRGRASSICSAAAAGQQRRHGQQRQQQDAGCSEASRTAVTVIASASPTRVSRASRAVRSCCNSWSQHGDRVGVLGALVVREPRPTRWTGRSAAR